MVYFQGITLNEISQREKQIPCDLTQVESEKTKHKQKNCYRECISDSEAEEVGEMWRW